MSEIDGIRSGFHPSPIQPNLPKTSQANRTQNSAGLPQHSDRVEISNVARFLSQIASMPDIRPEKVEALRNALLQGNYDVDTRFSQALDRFLDEYQT